MKVNKGQVSIIIPTYNRCHLIGETLDSVIAQSYKNWECLVVDDNSTDHTSELMEFYVNRDQRFKYYKRPESLRPGANTCRNLGLKLSIGEYLIFFDSDDIMLQENLAVHVHSLVNGHYDFSISKFDNLVDGNVQSENFFKINNRNEITLENYLRFYNFWGTINVVFKRETLGGIRFNEFLRSGQEYNFFLNVLAHTDVIPVFIDQVLSIRRVHEKSVQSEQKTNQAKYLLNKYLIFKTTFEEIQDVVNSNDKRFLLKNCQSFSFRLACSGKCIPDYHGFNHLLFKEIGLKKLALFNFSIISGYLFKKGYHLLYLSFSEK